MWEWKWPKKDSNPRPLDFDSRHYHCATRTLDFYFSLFILMVKITWRYYSPRYRVLDLSNNRIEDPEIVEILSSMPNLVRHFFLSWIDPILKYTSFVVYFINCLKTFIARPLTPVRPLLGCPVEWFAHDMAALRILFFNDFWNKLATIKCDMNDPQFIFIVLFCLCLHHYSHNTEVQSGIAKKQEMGLTLCLII